MSETKGPSMLSLALRSIVKEEGGKKDEDSAPAQDSALEQAMTDLQNATSASDRAAAFRAALKLAQ